MNDQDFTRYEVEILDGVGKDERAKKLKYKMADYVAMVANSIADAAPVVGPFLSEVAGAVLLNQKFDRLCEFATVLDERLTKVEASVLNSNLSNEHFTDLVEEGMRQASRSLSDDRREYIASLIANSLTSEEIEFIETKHLLRILFELNDIEIIFLRSYVVNSADEIKVFQKKHKEVLTSIRKHNGFTKQDRVKQALDKSYKDHLLELGLLERVVNTDQPKRGSKVKTNPYKITLLGVVLLVEVDLHEGPWQVP